MADEKHGAGNDDGDKEGKEVDEALCGEDGFPDMVAEELDDSRRDGRSVGRNEGGF